MEIFNKTDHSYSLAGPHDSDDIEEVAGSKVKVTETFSAQAYLITPTFKNVFKSFLLSKSS